MFEHILIAYDASEPAERALKAGAQLAHAVGARVTLFHNLIEGPVPARFEKFVPKHMSHGAWVDSYVPFSAAFAGVYYDAGSLFDEELQAVGKGLLEKAGAKLEAHGVTDYDTETQAGDPGYNILEYARKRGVDTIVVGSRGHGRLAELAVGSVSHKIQHGFNGYTLIVR